MSAGQRSKWVWLMFIRKMIDRVDLFSVKSR